MDDVTIIIGTLQREKALKACLTSIRDFYPTIPVLVIDDGPERDPKKIQEKKRLVSGFQAKYYKLAYDTGAGEKRNFGIRMARTNYVVILDDDFVFTGRTNLLAMRSILEQRPEITILGGEVKDLSGHHGTRGSRLIRGAELNKDGSIKFRYFHRYKIENPSLQNIAYLKKEYSFYPCSYVRTFMMIRKHDKIHWDPDLKTNPDHIDFFLRMQELTMFKVVYCPTVSLKHIHQGNSVGYEKMRKRRDFWKVFYAKTGFRFGFFYPKGNMLIRDYKEGRLVPWEKIQYLFEGKQHES